MRDPTWPRHTWRSRELTWIVLSWDSRAPRATLRLDGYYRVRGLADAVAERGAWGRRAGYVALVLPVSPGTDVPAIPNELFDAPWLEYQAVPESPAEA
jgi:hypothetical protein